RQRVDTCPLEELDSVPCLDQRDREAKIRIQRAAHIVPFRIVDEHKVAHQAVDLLVGVFAAFRLALGCAWLLWRVAAKRSLHPLPPPDEPLSQGAFWHRSLPGTGLPVYTLRQLRKRHLLGAEWLSLTLLLARSSGGIREHVVRGVEQDLGELRRDGVAD